MGARPGFGGVPVQRGLHAAVLAGALLAALLAGATLVRETTRPAPAATTPSTGSAQLRAAVQEVRRAVGGRQEVPLTVIGMISERPDGAVAGGGPEATFSLQLTIIGAATDPIVELVRTRRVVSTLALLDGVTGRPDLSIARILFGVPTLQVAGTVATIHVSGTATVSAGAPLVLSLPSGGTCPRSRVISVETVDYLVDAVGTGTGSGPASGCSAAAWSRRGPSSASLVGGGTATVYLTPSRRWGQS